MRWLTLARLVAPVLPLGLVLLVPSRKSVAIAMADTEDPQRGVPIAYSGDSTEAWDASTGPARRPPRYPWVAVLVTLVLAGVVSFLSPTVGWIVLAVGLLISGLYGAWLRWTHSDRP
jgi:hypothetical protein